MPLLNGEQERKTVFISFFFLFFFFFIIPCSFFFTNYTPQISTTADILSSFLKTVSVSMIFSTGRTWRLLSKCPQCFIFNLLTIKCAVGTMMNTGKLLLLLLYRYHRSEDNKSQIKCNVPSEGSKKQGRVIRNDRL